MVSPELDVGTCAEVRQAMAQHERSTTHLQEAQGICHVTSLCGGRKLDAAVGRSVEDGQTFLGDGEEESAVESFRVYTKSQRGAHLVAGIYHSTHLMGICRRMWGRGWRTGEMDRVIGEMFVSGLKDAQEID